MSKIDDILIPRLLAFLISFIFINPDVSSQEDVFLLFGGSGIEEGRSLLQTPSGGYMVAGRTRSIGSGSDDYYLLGLNTQFDVFIDKPFGGPHQDRCYSAVALDNGTYGLLGHSWDFADGRLNFNLTIVDPFGELVDRIVFFREKRDLGLKIIKTSDNGVVMAGMVDIGELWAQMFIMKTDADYNVIWESNFGGIARKDYAYDVIENEKGYLLIGTYSGFYGMYPTFPDFQELSDIGVIQLDFDGDTLWTYRYTGEDYDFGYSICQVDGTIYALGATRSVGSGSFDILLLTIDTDGNLINNNTYGDIGFEYGYKIISDSDDNIVIVGASDSYVDKPALYVLKLNSEGTQLFEKRIEGIDAVYGYDIIENVSGNYMITGTYTINETDKDVFLLEMNKEGDLIPEDTSYFLPEKPILVYPNPIIGGKTIISTLNNEMLIESILIFDALGCKVEEISFQDPQHKVRLNVAELKSGYYILNIKLTPGGEHVSKIIVY